MSSSVELVKFHLFGMFLINLNAEIVACILSFRKSRHNQIWKVLPNMFFPQIWAEKWRRSEHAHASYPGLFFRPPGFSPYMGRGERRVQGLDYWVPVKMSTKNPDQISCSRLGERHGSRDLTMAASLCFFLCKKKRI